MKKSLHSFPSVRSKQKMQEAEIEHMIAKYSYHRQFDSLESLTHLPPKLLTCTSTVIISSTMFNFAVPGCAIVPRSNAEILGRVSGDSAPSDRVINELAHGKV